MNNSAELAPINKSFVNIVDNLFYQSCNEKAILNKKLNHLLGNQNFSRGLDVGSGPGLLSGPLYERCQHLVLLELLKEYKPALQKQYPNASVIIDSFLNYVPKETFDIILCSHVLYYFSKKRLNFALEKLVQHLSKCGLLIIILLDCNFLLQYFKPALEKKFGVNFIDICEIYDYLSCRGKVEFIDYYFDKTFNDKGDFIEYVYQFLALKEKKELLSHQQVVDHIFSHLEIVDNRQLMQQHGKILLFKQE